MIEGSRNGAPNNDRERKVAAWIAGIAGFYVVSLFLVPMLMPANSVPELSVRANTIDYWSEGSWGNHEHEEGGAMVHNQSAHGGAFVVSELNPYFLFVYAFGDLNCHQKHERSWEINGNQMAVCARDVGIFFGITIGALWFAYRGRNRWTVRDTFLTLLPDEWLEVAYVKDQRLLWMWGLLFIIGAPMVLDGGIQAVTAYESTNPMRLATGAPFGFAIAWLFASSLSARPQVFDHDASKVILPGGARLVSTETEVAPPTSDA